MTVRRDRHGHVEIITIDRPQAMNAIDLDTAQQLAESLRDASQDVAVRAVVLTGAGDRSFCAGIDLKAVASGAGEAIVAVEGGLGGITRRDFPKPLIAAVNGHCLAGGLEIALACDLIIAAEHATFGLPEVKVGLIAGEGGLARLPSKIGSNRAALMALTGVPVTAQVALEYGLVGRVVAAPRLLDEALCVAELIARNSPAAVRASKEVLALLTVESERAAFEQGHEIARRLARLPDALEGTRAFRDKRSPVWNE